MGNRTENRNEKAKKQETYRNKQKKKNRQEAKRKLIRQESDRKESGIKRKR